MDCQSFLNLQKARSPTIGPVPQTSSLRQPTKTTNTQTIEYYSKFPLCLKPYDSNHTQGHDLRVHRPPTSPLRPSRSASANPFIRPTPAVAKHMSTYSSSTQDSAIYSSPGPRHYQIATQSMMSSSKKMSPKEKEENLRSLRTHRVNTLTELRRIEKLFASDDSSDVTEAMTTAWAHYVNSNNLLSELRGLTKNYPFSSECLDEAKWQVIGDPASSRSWNYCWLILMKIRSESLIHKHARLLAAKPAMWGGKTPTGSGEEKLKTACVNEWTRALDQMLRQWSSPPGPPGR